MGKKEIVIILCTLFIFMTVLTNSYSNNPMEPIKNTNNSFINSSDRVLIIAPHPDDEAISSAGVIRYCVENNIPIKVVVVTDGDVGRNLTMKRHNESVKAMQILGLNSNDLIFLGYHDNTLPRLLTKNWDYDHLDSVNGDKTNIKYIFSYQKNATYCGANLEQNLEEIITKIGPTVILYPDSEDEQVDHWATNAFVEYATARLNYGGKKYTYIVHDPPDWPNPRTYNFENYLTPPPELTPLGYKWVIFPLRTYQERLKETAINTYSSQVNFYSYIQAFIRKNELFGIDPIIKVSPSYQSEDYFSTPDFPNTVIKEPKKHDKGKGSIRSREITGLGFEINGDKAWISLRTKDNLSSTKSYEIHIISFNGDNIQRVDVNINQGNAVYETFNNNSFQTDAPILLQIKEGGCLIQIPSTIFQNSSFFLMSSDVYNGDNMIDWTAWRRIYIANY